MKKFKAWWALATRKWRLTIAGALIRKLNCVPIGGDVLLQAVEKIAQLESYIERSGEIRHKRQAYDKLMSRVREVSQIIEAATRVGDPSTRAEELVRFYMTARWNSMSRNAQRKYEKQAMAQAHTQLPPRSVSSGQMGRPKAEELQAVPTA